MNSTLTISQEISQQGNKIPTYFTQEDGNSLSALLEECVFKQQAKEVKQILISERLIESGRVDPEVDWFYCKLGIDSNYFESTPAMVIARHILSLYAAKMVSHATGAKLEVQLQSKTEGSATFISPSNPGKRDSPAMAIEQHIESQYFGEGYHQDAGQDALSHLKHVSTSLSATSPHGFRLACYRTTGTVSSASPVHLRLYYLTKPVFPTPESVSESETDLAKIGDVNFLARSSDATKKIYQEVMNEVVHKLGPVIKHYPYQTNGARLVIAYRRGSTHSYWSAISELYHYHRMYATHKYVEQFSNGIVIYSIYIRPLQPEVDINSHISKIAEQASLVYVLPRTSLTPLFLSHQLSFPEVTYAYVGWKFAYQFLNRYATEYSALSAAIGDDSTKQAMLAQLKTRLSKDTFTEGRVRDALLQYPELVKSLYSDFEKYHFKGAAKYDLNHGQEIITQIKRTVNNELDSQIFTAILSFNRHLLKTNFYKQTKTALVFRLDPGFLSSKEYLSKPFAVFFVVGSEFRGFHIRFRDIARGGIRIIRSQNTTQYDHNSSSLFDENYNLASTQQSKNKDIPEGGSKGTILLSADHQGKAEVAFRKYIDALLDLLLPNEEIIDHFAREEILFLGPDEGTADFMNWASAHAKQRGAHFWKAFTTGKSLSKGGIPHDLYGMTTRSIHQYVLGTLEKMGLDESKCTKFQTGGPDGDLGSNEIKISKDKTIGIVDGSGVIFDPEGLNREEITRLAGKRQMARYFDKTKLSATGFFVDVADTDVKLPNGEVVESGLIFRNNFHLNPLVTADIFVPCGGRPESVGLVNVDKLYTATGECRFPIIVEGANLFFTQKARLMLEERGAIIFKDASANKGGVTSSSLEVLSALALTDSEFDQHMCVKDGVIPAFYEAYIKDVHHTIENNARLEFECIWREHAKSKTPRSILSDLISDKINSLNDSIQDSPLWDNQDLKKKIISAACPPELLKLLGVDKIVERVPVPYVKAIFGSYLASRFVYECGLSSPEFAFFTFITRLLGN
ncbi:NAD+ dependent glutamate dehydrogenase [Heterostelium album PN500]|uniref:NAD+ dependent glutamate dehydrogenase n=1 Tax=Heterostelium pallidum (strain ATCC 26659 / Pp 5 / PN500) TaxID=670386 RepID=D3BT84_HETP5|nr:NAD+ dependent glutamate dehydrogenase [Heterostelium album PN500]EFA75301.1 NAD+ dependent glutamate dehydrogenase [Heterostelium album PN500]|eukprot:XP_020427435.1 NAD+ dependent glutamate dehydrogenase [Heterostelium album PN500]